MLCGMTAMMQASGIDGVAFDPFSFQQDGLASREVDVGRREIGDALVVSPVDLVGDEVADCLFEGAGQMEVLGQDAVFEGLVPAFDLALGLGMHRRPADVIHAVVFEPVRQIAGNVTRPVVAQQPPPVYKVHAVEPDALSAMVRVSVTSPAFMVVHSFQATM
jgi:hypothetical protein